MCVEKFDATGIEDARESYEIEEHLRGFSAVNDVTANFIDGHIIVDWDEDELESKTIIDEIEKLGCAVDNGGLYSRVKSKLV